MKPEWWPGPGSYDFPGTLFPCNSTWFFVDFPPTCPRNLLFLFVLLRPQKNNTNSIFLEILVSFWVPVRGGITHFSGSVCHHSRTEREFCKITPTKHMVFEANSVPALTLDPPVPKWAQGTSQGAPMTLKTLFFPLCIAHQNNAPHQASLAPPR